MSGAFWAIFAQNGKSPRPGSSPAGRGVKAPQPPKGEFFLPPFRGGLGWGYTPLLMGEGPGVRVSRRFKQNCPKRFFALCSMLPALCPMLLPLAQKIVF